MFQRLFTAVVVCVLALPVWVSAEYLTKETLRLVPDGRRITTSRPLDPSRTYHLTISGDGYSVRPLLRCWDITRRLLITWSETRCAIDLYINSSEIPRQDSHTDTLPMYFYDDVEDNFFVDTLTVRVHGNGKKLQLQTVVHVTDVLPLLHIQIVDPIYERDQRILAHERWRAQMEKEYQERKRKERQRLEREKAKAAALEKERLAAEERRRVQAEERALEKRRVLSKTVGLSTLSLSILCVLIAIVTTPARDRARIARLEAEHLEAERRAAEERAQREAAEARCHKEQMARYEHQHKELALEFDGRGYLRDFDFLGRYAKQHRHELLERRDEIRAAHRELYADPGYISYLMHHAPELIECADWQWRAFCLAEAMEGTSWSPDESSESAHEAN